MSSESGADGSAERPESQSELARSLLERQGIMRLADLREAGVSAATMNCMERDGEVVRLSGDIFHLSDDGWKYNPPPRRGEREPKERPDLSVSEMNVSVERSGSQRELARSLLEKRGIMRLIELRKAGVSAATMRRMERNEEVFRLSRGIYRLSNAGDWDSKHDYAQAAKRVPKGVVCLVSALAFHRLTIAPRFVWMAIANDDWVPRDTAGLRIVRFTENRLQDDIETHVIDGVAVRVFEVSRTVVDCFRYRNKIGLAIAIEGLRWTFRRRKASPAKIIEQAEKYKVRKVIEPYIEALLSDG